MPLGTHVLLGWASQPPESRFGRRESGQRDPPFTAASLASEMARRWSPHRWSMLRISTSKMGVENVKPPRASQPAAAAPLVDSLSAIGRLRDSLCGAVEGRYSPLTRSSVPTAPPRFSQSLPAGLRGRSGQRCQADGLTPSIRTKLGIAIAPVFV